MYRLYCRGFRRRGDRGIFGAEYFPIRRVASFPGVKVAKLVDFPFFPNRRIVLSVGVRFPGEFDEGASEAEIRDLCISDARSLLSEFSNKAVFFNVQRQAPDAFIEQTDGNLSSLTGIDFAKMGKDAGMLRVGKMDDGGYSVIIGGVVNDEGCV